MMIKSVLLGTLFLILILNAFLLQEVSSSPELDSLRSQVINSRQYVIPVTDVQTYQNLILAEKQKPIVLFLTVGADRTEQCPYCSVFQKILKELARKAQNENIYFAQVEFTAETQRIAQQLQINQVPVVFLFKPATPPIRCDLSKEQLHDFIEENTGIHIDFSEQEMVQILANDPVFKQAQQQQQQQRQEGHPGGARDEEGAPFAISSLMRFLWQISFIILGAVLSIISLPYITQMERKTYLTMGCWFLYIVCLGGTVYNMIHQTELFHFNPYTGKTTFLYPEMRGQLGLEGYFAVACMVIGGACFVACTQLVPLVQNVYMKRLVSLFLFSMFWICFGTVFVFFSMKMAGYMHGSPVSSYVQLATTLFGGE